MGARINDSNEQLKLAKGYDHNFVLNHGGTCPPWLREVEEPNSGRVLEVLHNSNLVIQFYTGNFLDGTIHGIGGVYRYRSALMSGNPTLPRFAESSEFSKHRSACRTAISQHHNFSVFGKIGNLFLNAPESECVWSQFRVLEFFPIVGNVDQLSGDVIRLLRGEEDGVFKL